jgi:hypothetical protein
MRTTHTPLTTAAAEANVGASVAMFISHANNTNNESAARAIAAAYVATQAAMPGTARAYKYVALGNMAYYYQGNAALAKHAQGLRTTTRDAVSANRR